MYQVYILNNREADKFYIGQTKDLDERLALHKRRAFNKGYTSKIAGEWNLIYKEDCSDRSSALRRERQLKSFRGRQFVKSLLPR